ncbi:MAG: M42 family metallopeptidase [Oscillospiraceae bacterium]|nr:M42 family metallopeptidase [Oscillospiraceae bacterium]
MDLKKIIFELSEAKGVSGSEENAAQTALKYLKNYTSDCLIKNGNVIGHFGKRSENVPHVMIDAHIDQIGLIVTAITDDGFIKVSNVGGIDRRLLPAQRVVIHGKKDIKAVVSSVPPHLAGAEKGKALKIEDICIDAGMSRDDLLLYVSPGDKISFDTTCRELLNGRITGSALDDRSGVASVLYALELLDMDNLSCSFSVVFSTQEELGERGAKIAAYEINPDIAVAVDVSFAYTCGDKEYECGKLGNGPMIGISPSLSREISEKLIDVCCDKNIPFQREVMHGLTSTNADQFSVNREGCKACTVSVPLKYMHTPSEVIMLEDVRHTGELLAEFLRRC